MDFDLDGIEDRTLRMTLHSARLADAQVTPDGEKILYLARFEKGYDLWVFEPRKKEVKLLAKLEADRIGDMLLDKEGEKAFILADRQLKSVEVEGGKVKGVALEARMELDAAAEREYLFEHAWRQTREKFYLEDMGGVDWDLYRAVVREVPALDRQQPRLLRAGLRAPGRAQRLAPRLLLPSTQPQRRRDRHPRLLPRSRL